MGISLVLLSCEKITQLKLNKKIKTKMETQKQDVEIEDKTIFQKKLRSVTFTPLMEYEDDEDQPQRFIYFLSEYHHECFNRQGAYLRDYDYKQIFGYKCKGVECEDRRSKKHGGLLVQCEGSYFSSGNRVEKSRLVGHNTQDNFYSDEPVEPDYVLVGKKSQLIESLKQKVESVRQAEICDIRKQGIEAILLDSSQISDNFSYLIDEKSHLKEAERGSE